MRSIPCKQVAPYGQARVAKCSERAFLPFRFYSRRAQPPAAFMRRQRGDLSPCGQSPMDFESITLATRSHCLDRRYRQSVPYIIHIDRSHGVVSTFQCAGCIRDLSALLSRESCHLNDVRVCICWLRVVLPQKSNDRCTRVYLLVSRSCAADVWSFDGSVLSCVGYHCVFRF